MKQIYRNDPLENIGFRSQNKTERELYNILTNDGYTVVKRGWPDFACLKNGEIILIEVKPNKDTHLKTSQYKLMKALSDKGIKCFRWSPDMGFQPIY